MNEKSLLIALFALLERENSVSIPQIAQLLGVGEGAVWELLEKLVFAYDAADLRLELASAHASLRRHETYRILRLNETETSVLLDALETQGIEPDSELVRKLLAAKGFLADSGSAPEARLRTVQTRLDGIIVQTIAHACEDDEHRLVRIDYQKDGAAAVEAHIVEAYAIRSVDAHQYLHAYDRTRGAWRTFRMDRIKDAEVLEGTYKPRSPEGKGGAMRTATIRFAGGALPDDWRGLTETRKLEDGGTEAAIGWYGSMWLPKKIVAAGGSATPLAPPELKEACADYARRLLNGCA